MGAAWEGHPGEPLPAVFPGGAEQQAAYRFLHNKKVGVEDILQPHREALVERCRQEPTVLLVQDTTTLNYTGLKDSTSDLGPLQSRESSARGLFVHAAVAFTAGRRPLGVGGLETWARPEAEPEAEPEKESRRWFRGFDQGRALGRACPETRVVVVGDRESDIYGLLKWQAEPRGRGGAGGAGARGPAAAGGGVGPGVAGDDAPGFGVAVGFREAGEDGAGGAHRLAGREAGAGAADGGDGVAHRAVGPATPEGPARRRSGDGVGGAGAGARPAGGTRAAGMAAGVERGGPTAEWAERIVGWYEARWGIEEYFRVLKSGTRIEDRRLQDADALVKCLAFDAITAWRVFNLDRYARDAPDTPADDVLSGDERQVIGLVVQAERLLPPAERGRPFPPDIRSWVVLLARMAGWRPSKRRPLPGNEVLWRAFVQLQTMVRVTQAARAP